MPQDVKVWEIIDRKTLKEISKSKLDLEERLEDWLGKDISIISNDLLVIGRQVETGFGGVIDLLCIDYNGDILIVELKREKTPREIVAQVLDYASWTKDLSNEKITEIANGYFGDRGPLEEAFKRKFGTEIPEILNEHHKMLVVASEIDNSSERIIKYLSDSYGVGINAITFQYFQNEEGREFLARVFLIEPSEAEYRIQTKSTSKRKPPLSYEELHEIAERNGVGYSYKKMVAGLSKCFDQTVTTMSSIAFIGIMGERKSRATIFSILPKESDSEKGLRFTVYIDRFADYCRIAKTVAMDALPSYEKKAEYEEWAGEFGGGFFREENQIEKFLADLTEFKQR
ncbi:MAG: endonuclease NucS domain-containing protein [Pseudomonadota bacterium]